MSKTLSRESVDGAGVDRRDVERMVDAVAPEWSVERVRACDEGSTQVFFLTVGTPAGSREVVLKVLAGDVVDDDAARSEPRFLELLSSETEIPVPDVVGFVDDRPDLPTPFFVAERRPNDHAGGRFGELPIAALERALGDAGRHLAELHDVRTLDRFGRVGVADDDLAVVDGEYGRRDRWADWLLADAEDSLDGLAGGRFDDLVPRVREYLREAVPALDGPDAASFVHWDYRFENVLLDPETGAITTVLDWADLVAGDPVYNLVAVEDHNINWQTRDVVLRRRLRDRLYSAYDARRAGEHPDDFYERKRVYHLCHRLNAMACLPDWYADASEAVTDERAGEHRTFVREYLE